MMQTMPKRTLCDVPNMQDYTLAKDSSFLHFRAKINALNDRLIAEGAKYKHFEDRRGVYESQASRE